MILVVDASVIGHWLLSTRPPPHLMMTVFTGGASLAAPHLIEYSFAEPPTNQWGQNSPSIHFRHRGRANIAWADGHVTAELMTWTYDTPNGYGANNRAMKLGWFGPTDNSMFVRD